MNHQMKAPQSSNTKVISQPRKRNVFSKIAPARCVAIGFSQNSSLEYGHHACNSGRDGEFVEGTGCKEIGARRDIPGAAEQNKIYRAIIVGVWMAAE